MSRCNVAACFFPQQYGCETECGSESLLRAVLGDNANRVDSVMNHCTPHCVAAAIARCIREGPNFPHHLHVIAGVGRFKEIMIACLIDMIPQPLFSIDVPLQCMMFASEEGSVVCKLFDSESMPSLLSTANDMEQIFLVSLRHERRMVTIVAVEQLSTSLVASMLGSVCSNIWVLLSGLHTTEREMSLLNEAMAIRDAVREFSSAVGAVSTELHVEEESSAHATPPVAVEVVHPSAPSLKGVEDNDTAVVVSSAEAETVSDTQSVARRLEESQCEVNQLRKKLEEAEDTIHRFRAAERRAEEEKKNLSLAESLAATTPVATSERAESLFCEGTGGLDSQNSKGNENWVGERTVVATQRELSAMQAKLSELQRCLVETSEGNLGRVREFQCRELEWQRELRRRTEERDVALQECERLRGATPCHGSQEKVFSRAVETPHAHQEQELDNLLSRIRSITAAHGNAAHSEFPMLFSSQRSAGGAGQPLSPRGDYRRFASLERYRS
ncbi:uncharacterized protein TEOVI_000560700 [Trypanosoma equiperdum]|uniref:Uncharacterized protein n=2 Tax=Trypanozoon TaxID=39700 RepID=Q586Z0_TRYB2|nr:hypothetical protein, conserved [Trypanosoma brucei brucei TREU927]AAX79287.1 hypothetical protein, conserved [Trypanosoma brucei]AAZ11982.1 hypothetical protein, conserved [Trypanosoma brucei brucei TREU927]SCU65315.1 hypothetical protein, conserved [Trypanosoma equiperdum]